MKPDDCATAAVAGVGRAGSFLRCFPRALSTFSALLALASFPAVGAATQGAATQAVQSPFSGELCVVGDAPPPEPGVSGTPERELERISRLARACEGSAHFHAYQGVLLLSVGKDAEAASALEKALLLDPERPGVQLDYAQALARIGQRRVAQSLVQQVTERSDIDPALRLWLREQALPAEVADPAHRPTAGAASVPSLSRATTTPHLKWSGIVQTSAGRESNLNSATSTRELQLYLVDGPVLVQLADNQRPVGGPAQRLAGALQAEIERDVVKASLSAYLQTRSASQDVAPEQQFVRLEAGVGHTTGAGALAWTIARQELRQGELFAATDSSVLGEFVPGTTLGPCAGAAALGLADQRYPLAENMAGVLRFARAEVRCSYAGAWRVGFSSGVDRPRDPERPGGTKQRKDVYMRYERLFQISEGPAQPLGASQIRLTGWARRADASDSRLSSALLGSDPTRTSRTDYGLGVGWVLSRAWQVSLEVESNQQRSSNPLLNLRNLSSYVTLRWSASSAR